MDAFSPTREMIDAVVDWRARNYVERCSTSLVQTLKSRFGLTAKEAIAVVRAAQPKEVLNAS